MAEQPSVFEPMLRHFVRVLERLDIWDADMMGLFAQYWADVQKMLAMLDAKGCTPEGIALTGRIWTGMVAMGHTFEEALARMVPSHLPRTTPLIPRVPAGVQHAERGKRDEPAMTMSATTRLENHRTALALLLQKDELTRQAKNNTDSSVGVAISRLTKTNEIRSTGAPGELPITPKGQKRVIEKIIPKLKA